MRPIRPKPDSAQDPEDAAELARLLEESDREVEASQLTSNPPINGVIARGNLAKRLEAYAVSRPNSAWTPGSYLRAADIRRGRGNYSKSIESYSETWRMTKEFRDTPGTEIRADSSGFWRVVE